MLQVKTYIATSKIHGIGLFAGKDIAKGSIIWKFTPEIDIEITEKRLSNLTTIEKFFIDMYAYLDPKLNKYILCTDNGRFINHSDSPNCDEIESEDGYGYTIANRNIKKGEELTTNYATFDKDFNTYSKSYIKSV